MNNTLARNWFLLGIISLALSGIIAPLLIIGRTIGNADGTMLKDYFQLSIIMHVNFGILMWLLSITAGYFRLAVTEGSKLPVIAAAIATAMVALSPFGDGAAYSNNYIPVFDNPVFKTGIALFLTAIGYESIAAARARIDFKTRSVAFLIILSLLAFGASYIPIHDQPSSHAFYETLFWGGGHILQFAYVQILLIAWLLIAAQAGLRVAISEKWLKIIFALPVLFVLVTTFYIYTAVPVESAEHINYFTKQMIFGNSLAALPIGLAVLAALACNLKKLTNAYYLALLFSFILFTLGGTLGTKAAHAVAQGEITTVIPAHYHGSVIAVTVALMGLVYHLLPALGGRAISNKWASIQIALYSLGQIMHIAGMAILGGHGAQRKTVGLDYMQLSDSTEKLIKYVMHGGGGLMAIGFFLFIILTLKSLLRK